MNQASTCDLNAWTSVEQASLRHASPMAMGRTLPPPLSNARRRAALRNGCVVLEECAYPNSPAAIRGRKEERS